jgi:regulator of nonsense transcripts 1
VDLPGADLFRKLLQLREDQGGLKAEDEKQLYSLRRRLEMEILEAADVSERV